MGWLLLAHLFSTILALFKVIRLSESDKDLEIVILRHQLAIMTRLNKKPVRPNRAEKLTLAILTKRLKKSTVSYRISFALCNLRQCSDGIENWFVVRGHINKRIKVAAPKRKKKKRV